jgi:sec-independent protein translocase protein TatA
MTLFITLGFLGLGGQEATLIIVALLLFFGGKKLPELARGLGKGIKEFKDASKGEEKKGEEKKEIEGGN